MIENRNDLLFHNLFKVGEIDHHTVFHMIAVGDGFADHSDMQFVAMAMHIPAFTIISVKGMTSFKGE